MPTSSALARTALFAGAALFVACGSDTATAPSVPAGSYDLVSIDGTPLPIVDNSQSPPETLAKGEVTIFTNDSASVEQTETSPGVNGLPGIAVIELGLYTVRANGSTLIFVPVTAPFTDTGTVSGNQLTIGQHQRVGNGVIVRTYVYSRSSGGT